MIEDKIERAMRIFGVVRENHKRATSCRLHIFVEMEEGELDLTLLPYQKPATGKQYRCISCDCIVDSLKKFWYDMGVEHGKSKASRQ